MAAAAALVAVVVNSNRNRHDNEMTCGRVSLLMSFETGPAIKTLSHTPRKVFPTGGGSDQYIISWVRTDGDDGQGR